MTVYIILIVVVAVVLLGIGGTMLLRPRGMHGVRRGRARELDLTGSMPKLDDTSAATGTATMISARTMAGPSGSTTSGGGTGAAASAVRVIGGIISRATPTPTRRPAMAAGMPSNSCSRHR